MSDKCQAHDNCIGRIHDTLDEIRDEFRQNHMEIKEMLHDERVIQTKQEMRISQLEQRGTDWKSLFTKLLFGLLEKGIIVVLGMAYWAHSNGFKP